MVYTEHTEKYVNFFKVCYVRLFRDSDSLKGARCEEMTQYLSSGGLLSTVMGEFQVMPTSSFSALDMDICN